MFLKLPNFHTYENGNNYNGSYNGMRFAIVINKNEDTKELTHSIHNYPAVMVYPISRNIISIVKKYQNIESFPC